MAKKATKEESLHELSLQELQVRLQESKEKSFRLRFQHTSNPLKNPMEIRTARREIAKILTVLRQKEKVA
jgi:large subunit ribosomal protein L29